MTTTQPRTSSLSQLAARALTEIFAPVVLIITQLYAVAIHASHSLGRGLLYGTIAAFFAGALPYGIILLGIRRGRLGDHHLTDRRERPAIMAIALISITVGLLITWRLGAPRDLFALVAAMVTGIVVSLAVTMFWKISIHAAGAAGTVAVLVLEFGSALWATLPIVAAVAWARVALRDHTSAQVITGSIVGFAIAASVMTALR